VLIAAAAAAMAMAAVHMERGETARSHPATLAQPHVSGDRSRGPARTSRQEVVVRRVGRLPAGAQDSAVAAFGGQVFSFGGLDAGGTSVATVTRISGATIEPAGRLPVPIHDAAAAAARGSLYVLGGGQFKSYAGIARFQPAGARTHIVGSLPTPLSDLAAAALGGTVYVVGGYDGTAFSNRILAASATGVRRVASLPTGLRYAAVAAVGRAIIIAGGLTPAGPSDAVYRFVPSRGVRKIGRLPQPLMHAGAAALGGRAYVVGGIGPRGSPVRSVLAVGADGRVEPVATMPRPISDAGVVRDGSRILVIGGSNGRHPVAGVLAVRLASTGPAVSPGPAQPPARFGGPLPGDLLIADRGNNRLLIVGPRHGILWRYPSRPGQPQLHFDDDAFFTPGGRSIISNEEDNHDIVQIAYPAGHVTWRYGHPGTPGAGAGYLNTPDDAYRLPGGMVIVSDDRNCRVLEIRGQRVVRSLGTPGSCVHDPPRSFASPNGDTPLPDGHVLVSEINGSFVDELTLSGGLVRSLHVPVAYPSDPQLTRRGNIILADYSRPGAIVIVDRRTGRLLWRYGPASGPGELDHPSLAAMLPNGDIIACDDYHDRIVIIDPRLNRIVWQYGHTNVPGTGHDLLNTPDGFDFIPVTPGGRPNPAAIQHGAATR
jgi:Kelch motif